MKNLKINTNKMNKRVVFIFSVIFLIGTIGAVTYNIRDEPEGTTFDNLTGSVNHSGSADIWITAEGDLDDVSDISHADLDDLEWSLSGHIIDVILDLLGFGMTTTGNVTADVGFFNEVNVSNNLDVSGNASFSGPFETECLHCEDGETYFHGSGFFGGNVTAPNIEVMESLIVHGSSNCTGTATACGDIMDSSLCGWTTWTGQRGCRWTFGGNCIGTATPCEEMSTATCEEQHVCSLTVGAGFIFGAEGFTGNITFHDNVTADYFYGDGSGLTGVVGANASWNETYLLEELSSTYYNPNEASTFVGTIDGGSLEDVKHADTSYDGITFNFSEVAGSPALDLRMNFTSVNETTFSRGIMRYKTSNLAGDYPIIQMWNYDEEVWEDYPSIGETSSFATITQPVFDAEEHLSGGEARMRIYKESNGNINNHYYVDWVAIVSGVGVPCGEEVDPLSYHRNENLNSSGYNITADYFIGDGSLLTGVSGGNSSWNETHANTLYAVAGSGGWDYNLTAPNGKNMTFAKVDSNSLTTFKDSVTSVGSEADITDDMTSNTAPSPNVVSADSEFASGYAAWYAFNHVSSDRWISSAGTNDWLKFDFGNGNSEVVARAILTAPGTSPEHSPKDFSIDGSNNNVDWVVLETVTGESPWTASEQRTWDFSNSVAYRYYRLNVTASINGAYVALGELELIDLAGVPKENIILQSRDGISADEFGAVELGADDVRLTLNGKTIRQHLYSVLKYILDTAGFHFEDDVQITGNMNITGNLNITGCIQYNATPVILGVCV